MTLPIRVGRIVFHVIGESSVLSSLFASALALFLLFRSVIIRMRVSGSLGSVAFASLGAW
jgi:hypothetical protein